VDMDMQDLGKSLIKSAEGAVTSEPVSGLDFPCWQAK
jgi:hypothetical protein